MSSCEIILHAGRSSTGAGSARIKYDQWNNYTYRFVIAGCGGEFSFNRVYRQSSTLVVTPIFQSHPTRAILTGGGYIYVSYDDSTSIYGATLCMCTFAGYSDADVIDIMSSIRVKDKAGFNSGTTAKVSLTCPQDSLLINFYSYNFSVYCPVNNSILPTASTGNDQTQPKIFYSGGKAYISTDATSASDCQGGASIIRLA